VVLSQNFKVYVMHLSWMLPILHLNLPRATQLDAGLTKKVEQLKARLGKNRSSELIREAYNT